jgi:hypothetical protein
MENEAPTALGDHLGLVCREEAIAQGAPGQTAGRSVCLILSGLKYLSLTLLDLILSLRGGILSPPDRDGCASAGAWGNGSSHRVSPAFH